MIRIDGNEIESQYIEYGVIFKEGDQYTADDELDARIVAEISEGSTLVASTVYETAWAEVTK